MATIGKLACYQAIFLAIIMADVRSLPIQPSCRCIDHYNSRAPIHDVSCYGINTEDEVDCASDYLSNISLANTRFQMTLSLQASSLRRFPSDFLEPYSVIGLVLDGCKISKIPKRLIRPACITLTTLEVRNSDLKTIPSSALPHCTILSSLLVQNNSIETVAGDAFKNLFSLQELDLRQNHLRNFSGFSGIENLKMLNLAHNRLERIEKGALKSMPMLHTIFLNNNHLEVLDVDTFDSLPDLHYLNLSCNRLHSFDGFRGIGLLGELSLSFNHILSVDGDAFLDLGNLRMLYMDHNNISTLAEGTFDPLDKNPDIALVNLEGNPLHCNCSLKWLQSWFAEHPNVQGKESIMCSSPTQLSLMDFNLCGSVTTVKLLDNSTTPAATTVPKPSSLGPASRKYKPTLNPSLVQNDSKPGSAPSSSKRSFLEIVILIGVSIFLLAF